MEREPVRLIFGDKATIGKKDVRLSLSAGVRQGNVLWVASDETTCVDRLIKNPKGYGDAQRFDLRDHLDLPDETSAKKGQSGEIDIEGMDVAGGALWLVGSHSLRRPKLIDKDDVADVDKFANIERDPNRYTLARVPIVDDDDIPTLAGRGSALGRNALVDSLQDDEHIKPFLAIPGKDNGLDIEGLAISGDRMFLGLRGPVLGGWAIIVEIATPQPVTERPEELALTALGQGDRIYRKHFLALGGLGVRDLCIDNEDLLVLAGPSSTLNCPATIFRWNGGARPSGSSVVTAEQLGAPTIAPTAPDRTRRTDATRKPTKPLVTPSKLDSRDHAEGITRLGDGQVLVIYDSPADVRTHDKDGSVDADRLELVN
jgi:hypothetical protein